MTSWVIITAAALAIIGLAFLEWRRANRSHLAARVAATVLAVAALALLGLRPAWQRPTPSTSGTRAALWTSSSTSPPAADAVPTDIVASHRFALPDATRPDPAARPIPDAAFLRRYFPEIGTLRIFGDGLDPSELAALRGLHVESDSPTPSPGLPGIYFERCPRELNLGDPLVVQGSLGLHSDAALTLEAPDGTTANAVLSPADPTGETRFALQTASPTAAGRFLWHLRAPAAADRPAIDVPLGVMVVPPTLPRVLVLESAPRFDTGALRRWFESAGGNLTARTQVGQDRYRYASSAAVSPAPFTALDAPLLAGCDLVLADSRSILALPPAERDVLLAAVADTGLGVLLLPADDPPPADTASPLLPWKLVPLPSDPPGGDRPARLQWPGQSLPTDLPVPTAPFEIVPASAQRPLLGDRQGHTLAAAAALGRGQIGLTLVRDTTRWQRENDPAAFAAYWSFLFSKVARPDTPAAGHWSLVDGDAGPVFADHPLDLVWSGPATPAPGPVVVISTPAVPATTLAIAPDPAGPGRWRGTFWPREPGWHRVALASGGPAFDFYVSAAAAWPALAAERRRVATARFAAASVISPPALVAPATREEFPPVWLAALFFLSAGYLWIERRFA